MKLLWIDTETTGTDHTRHAVVQIAGIVEIDGQLMEEFEFFAKPHEGAQIEEQALAVIGKTREQISAYPAASEAYSKLIRIIQKYVPKYTKDVNQRFKIAGQNTHFDYTMMEEFWRLNGDRYWYASVDKRGIDVVLASALMKTAGAIDVTDLKLATICKALSIELDAHNALNDIRATRKIWNLYAKMIKKG